MWVMTKPPDSSLNDGIQQTLQALLVIVHAGTEIGNDLEGPALTCAVQFQNLFLSLQIFFLVGAGNTGIRHSLAMGLICRPKPLRTQLRQVVPAMASRRMFSRKLSGRFPSSERCDGDAQCFCRFAYPYESFHIVEIGFI